MKMKSKNSTSFSQGKFTSTAIVKGTASYSAFKREYASDLKAAWEAYKEAIHNSKNWVSEFEKAGEYSAIVYKTRYAGLSVKTEISENNKQAKFTVIQKIRVSVKEVTNIIPCIYEEYEEWEKKEKKSELAPPPIRNLITPSPSCGNIPGSAYKIIKGYGANWEDTFGDITDQLESIKICNHMWDYARRMEISLKYSCDEFEMLRGHENFIEAGVKMTMPDFYKELLKTENLSLETFDNRN
ncbi:MAG: hypothetical protein JST15_06210 [Bacteroidetes bacterium]|nr:hypothetical protein [Bacteroidota bacterium]